MGSIRDQQCSADIAKMAELGRFDDEIAVYGTVWLADGQRRYYLTTDGEDAYGFVRDKFLQDQCSTPVSRLLYRVPAAAGRTAENQQTAKIILGKTLQKQYQPAFLSGVAALAQVPRNDQALAPLTAMQQWLEGRFQKEELQYFKEIVDDAYIAKQLTEGTYRELCQWQTHRLAQLEDDVVIRKSYSRDYSGFYYWQGQDTIDNGRLYMDGQPQLVHEKQDLLRAEGYSVTPIFRKTYWFDKMSENKLCRVRFREETEQFWLTIVKQTMKVLSNLPSVVDAAAVQKKLVELVQMKRQEEKWALRVWANMWKVCSKED